MATTGELRAIIEELQLIDVGDAASYLGEEALKAGETHFSGLQQEGAPDSPTGLYSSYSVSSNDDLSFR
jgi:hypothetical protein